MVESCGFSRDDVVLEIGPGRGALTPLIAGKVKKVYAVELDRALAAQLPETLKDVPNLSVINADILRFDIRTIPETREGKIKVFGNIPYYITSPIIEHLFGYRAVIRTVFLTVQKEFAQRICAGPGSREYGSFSLYAQYYSRPNQLFTVKKNSFYPAPKVDSSFIRLDIRDRPPVEGDEKALFKVIRAAFQQRRKTLRNSLKGLIGEPELDTVFDRCRLDPKVRPERLSLQDFSCIAGQTAVQ
ncbi:MAG: 16S rRNA (adenine(1518)-N(6)/adenine(1519)-N(6))-dimethyltransferase RsmA [Deltaproteobacteria bacterium]